MFRFLFYFVAAVTVPLIAAIIASIWWSVLIGVGPFSVWVAGNALEVGIWPNWQFRVAAWWNDPAENGFNTWPRFQHHPSYGTFVSLPWWMVGGIWGLVVLWLIWLLRRRRRSVGFSMGP